MDNTLDGISIIMPAFNSSSTISESINSVLRQSYRKWELIVIDDNSTDATRKIVEKYAKENKNITLIVNDNNMGVAATRNIGIQSANFSWIAFLDSDDLWEKSKLKKQVDYLSNNEEAKLIYTGSAYIDKSGEKKKFTLEVPSSVSYEELLSQNIISCSSVLIEREEMLKYPMPELDEIHEDFVVWLEVLSEGSRAFGVQEPLLIYRLSENSKSGNKLKSAKMNWNVYKYLSIPFFKRIRLMVKYATSNLIKYFHIENDK